MSGTDKDIDKDIDKDFDDDEFINVSNLLHEKSLYQLQFLKNESKKDYYIIKTIGHSDKNMIVKLNQFKINKYDCSIVSYLHKDFETNIEMLGIQFFKKNKLKYLLNLNLTLSEKPNKNVPIFGDLNIVFIDVEKNTKKNIENKIKYTDNDIIIEYLIEKLSDEKVLEIL